MRKDFTSNAFWANMLAKEVQNFYHKRGYTDVRVWVEKEEIRESSRPIFNVRSNIKFSVPERT